MIHVETPGLTLKVFSLYLISVYIALITDNALTDLQILTHLPITKLHETDTIVNAIL